MAKSAVLNTIYRGWEDNSILTETIKEDSKFQFVNNAAKRYFEHSKRNNNSDTVEVVATLKDQPVLDVPQISTIFNRTQSKQFSKKIQSWKGIILMNNETTFTAKLFDLNEGGTYEIGEFDREDVSPDDLTLLAEGATFYWSVGHYMENGQSVKRSDLRFQRLVTLDEQDFENTIQNIGKKFGKLKERKIVIE